MEITKSRPVGVSILAVLLTIQGAFQIVVGLLAMIAAPGFVILSGNTSVIVRISPWGMLISGVLVLILAYGLWTLRIWAFWLTVGIELLNLIGGTIQLFTFYNPGAVLLSLVIPAIILIYFFMDRNVLYAFVIARA